MKKSHFILLIVYTISLLILALGICTYTVPEWHLQVIGLPVSILGLVLVTLSWIIQRRLSDKGAVKVNLELTAKVTYIVLALLTFGGGFAFVTSGQLLIGVILGLIGLLLLIGIIPVTVGLK